MLAFVADNILAERHVLNSPQHSAVHGQGVLDSLHRMVMFNASDRKVQLTVPSVSEIARIKVDLNWIFDMRRIFVVLYEWFMIAPRMDHFAPRSCQSRRVWSQPTRAL